MSLIHRAFCRTGGTNVTNSQNTESKSGQVPQVWYSVPLFASVVLGKAESQQALLQLRLFPYAVPFVGVSAE